MPQVFSLMKVDKKYNSTKQVDVAPVIEANVKYKTPTDIHNPTVIITIPNDKLDKVLECNYAKNNSNYYWIKSIVTISRNQIEVELKLDVLATFKEEILETKAFIMYSYNLGRPDVLDRRNVQRVTNEVLTSEPKLPKLFSQLETGTYLLQVSNTTTTGKHGTMALYILNPDQTGILSNVLMQDRFLSMCEKYRLKPNDFIHGFVWLPCDPMWDLLEPADAALQSVVIGDYHVQIGESVDLQGWKILGKKSIKESVELNLPDAWENFYYYKNCPELCKVMIYLPCYGYVEILNGVIHIDTKITVDITLDLFSCQLSYSIKLDNVILGVYTAQYGTSLPISSSVFNQAAIASGITAVTLAIAGAATENPAMMIGALGAGASTVSAATQLNQVSGRIGSAIGMLTEPYIKVVMFRTELTSDMPHMRKQLGLPLFQTEFISECEGYCQTSNFSIELSACRDEIDEINTLMNGGVYIE